MRRASQGLFRLLFTSGVLVAAVIGVLPAGGRARAQAAPPEGGFGDKGHFALEAERMFGYVHTSEKTGGGSTTTFNAISVLGSPIINVVTFPRVGFDGFIAPSISLGGSLTYFRISSATTGSATSSGFLVAPRVGFAGRVAPTVWIWPRAGITYVTFSTDGASGTSQSFHLLTATVELPVVVALAPQALLLIGPTLDLGLSGSTSLSGLGAGDPGSSDIKETAIGLQISFAFYF
jgi:hypothetical protein